MSRITIGGDPESYMEAPEISVGGGEGGGGGGFIASLLDLLGIQRQVAKGPKKSKKDDHGSETPQRSSTPLNLYTPPVPVLPVISEAEAMFGIPGMPITSAFRPTEVPNKISILDPNLLR